MNVAEIIGQPRIQEYNPVPGMNRCDACGARAYNRTVLVQDKKLLELEWCNHHFRVHEPTLAADGWIIQSRVDILEKECEAYKTVKDDKF